MVKTGYLLTCEFPGVWIFNNIMDAIQNTGLLELSFLPLSLVEREKTGRGLRRMNIYYISTSSTAPIKS
jgi:hypothetical protein